MLIKVAFIALLLAGCANGGWSREDTYRQTALTGLMAVDYAQTMKISREPDKYWERNPLLGKHPDEAEVTAYFIGAYAIKTGVAMALKPEYRKWWQYTMIGASAGCVGWNLHIGLGVGF
jgi:hypothetical protein